MDLLSSLMILFVTVSLLVFGVIVIRLTSAYAERGWAAHYRLMEKVNDYQSSRISTLENKLMSHNWVEYAQLQEVPDEVAKVTHLNIAKSNADFNEELMRQQRVLDGEDLEGEIFEGPTLG